MRHTLKSLNIFGNEMGLVVANNCNGTWRVVVSKEKHVGYFAGGSIFDGNSGKEVYSFLCGYSYVREQIREPIDKILKAIYR